VSDPPQTFQDEPNTHSRRVWVRAVVGVGLVIGMLAGWGAMTRQKSWKQSDAVKRIRAKGGHVFWDYQWEDNRPLPDGKPPQAGWLRSLFGDATFDRAVAVDLQLVAEIDDVAPLIRFLPELESLDAQDTNADDRLLSRLTSNRLLVHLDLSGTNVTDAGMGHVARLSQLRTLSLRETAVTDKGVTQLTRCARLLELDLRQTRTTAASLKRLQGYLSRCAIRTVD